MIYTTPKLLLAIIFSIAIQNPSFAQKRPVYHEIPKVYIVNTAEELLWIEKESNAGHDFTGETIVLTADIDLSAQNPWIPIGDSETNSFNGTFNGNGKEISGITINNKTQSGLFGNIGQYGVIKNTGVNNFSITQNSAGAVGSIAGTTNGVIINCYCLNSTISSTAPNSLVGGIAGQVKDKGIINNCFVGGSVTKKTEITNTDGYNGRDKKNNWNAGGIAGYSTGNISNCTVHNSNITGRKNGDYSRADHILAQNASPGKYQDNTYRGVTLINNAYSNHTGISTQKEPYDLLNLIINDNHKYGNLFYWNTSNKFNHTTNGVVFDYGNGTEGNPYLLTNYHEFKLVSEKVNEGQEHDKFFELCSDIKRPEESPSWIPIGKSKTVPFSGHFNGNDFQVENIKVDGVKPFAGLFGVTTKATIRNIRIHNVDIIAASEDSSSYAGAVIGYSVFSSVQNSIISGSITINASTETAHLNCFAGKVCGGHEQNSIFKNNYSTKETKLYPHSSEEGHNTQNGELIDSELNTIDLSRISDKALSIGNSSNVFLLRSNSDLDITVNNTGNIICLDNAINNLTVEAGSTQIGLLNTQNIYLMDGAKISEQGIKNENEIIYYRNFNTYAQKGCQGGWETICLPFNSTLYADGESKSPVLASTSGQFWLRKHVESSNTDNESVAFASLREFSEIEANTPYIIALPGDKYGSLSLMNKNISFRGTGDIPPFVSKNPQSNVNAGNYTFEGSFHGMEEATSVRFLLNNHTDGEGNGVEDTETLKAGYSFIQTSSIVNQFRAYFVEKNNSASTPSMLKIITGVDTPNDMKLSFEEKPTLKILSKGGVIIIETQEKISLPLFNAVSGIMVKLLQLNAGENRITDIPAGVYVLNGQKIMH